MAKKNEAQIQFTANTKEFDSAIKKSNEEMSQLRAEMKLNETQMKATGATVEGLENKHKILSAQLKASESRTQALSQKVDLAAKTFGENSTEANKLRVQLLNAQAAEEKFRQAVSACESELNEQRNAASQTENAIEKLNSTIDDQQAELSKLKSDYAAAVLEQGKYSKEARTLAKEIDSLSDELNDNQKRMNEVEAAADKLDNSLEQVDETAEKVSEGFTVMKGAMADLVADGIGAVVDGLGDIATEAFTMSNDIDKATNDFMAKTGESAESAKSFEAVMTEIYNGNYGESFEDIADAMATVKTSLGNLSDSELESITTDALVLRDTFDMDVNESVRAVNSLMDQFGITADEAFNLVAQGAQNGLNQNGDLLDVVNEYAVQFKNAGYSADDMFNMLANGTATGTWSVDKLGDAVKEFNIRMSDGSAKEAVEALGFSWEAVSEDWSKGGDSAKEVFNMLFNELDGLENTTEGYSIGVGLLGTMYEDLGQDAVLALSKTNGEISSTKDALGEINSVKYDDLGSAFEGIKRNLQTSLAEPIKNDVMPAVNEFVEDVDWQGVGQTIGEAFGAIVEAAFAIGEGIASAIGWMNEHKTVVAAVATAVGILTVAIGAYNAVNAIKAAMDAAQVTTVWGLVSAHIAQAAAAMAAIAPYVLIVAAIAAVIAIIVLLVKNWDKVVEVCKKAWEAIKDTLSQWGEWIMANVIKPVVKFFTGLWQDMKVIWDNICNAVKVALMFIGSIISAAVQVITLPFRFIWENCKQYVFAAWEWIKNAVTKAINKVKSVIATVMNAIKSVISTIWNSVKSVTSSIWNSIKSVITTVWNAIKSRVTTAVNAVKSVLTTVWNAIKSVTSTVWNGIKNAVSSVWNGIKSGVSSAVNAVKSTVSNVFNGIKSTATSVWNGIKNAIITPIEAAKSKVKGIVDSIKGFFSNMKISLPKIKLPHFSIKGSFSLNPPSVPKLSIDWYKDGGIMMRPTIFGMNGSSLMAGGEAGPEAILPIDRLEGYISGAIEKTMNVVNLGALAEAIEDLANRPIEMNINGRRFATATASDGDSVNGLRSSFRSRGLAIE